MECLIMLKQSAAILFLACGTVLFTADVTRGQVCVVDVARVFENHAGFNAELEKLKNEADEYKYSLQQRGAQLNTESEELNNFKEGSAEYNNLESRLAQASANLEVERRNKTREFVQREAKLHFDTYVQVTHAISEYCEQKGYRVALRFSRTEMDPDNPQSIMQRVQEYVVFHQPRIDITDEIIRSLPAAATQTGSRPVETENR
jgi:Skp family chaperone for outer membrane proteins